MSKYYDPALYNTATAGWLELLLAKIFGIKTFWCDGSYCIYSTHWRGKVYVTDIREN